MLAVFKHCWRQFLLIHLIINGLIFIILGPLAGALLQLVVAFSGDVALSDQDILMFLLKPVAFLPMLIVASIFSVIVFLEHAALLTLAYYGQDNRVISGTRLLTFLVQRGASLFNLALRILVRVLLVLLPFGLLLLLVYKALLGEYDINYYLSEKPPEFVQAALLGGLILVGLVFVSMRVFIDWAFCLPLLLINGMSPSEAMTGSKEAAREYRLHIAAWLAGWAIFSLTGAAAVGAFMLISGRLLLPLALDSFNIVLLVLIAISLLATVLNMGVAWISSSFLSLIIVRLFRDRGIDRSPGWLPAAGNASSLSSIFTWRRLTWALLAGLVFAALAVNSLLDRVLLEDRTEVMAHRGASAMAPENTLAAIQAAIDAGAHWVEIDVQETADDEIVVIHDSDLKKVGARPLKVADSSLAELQQVDIGTWFAADFSDQRIPTLKSVLELCKDRIGVNIELKYYGNERRLEQNVAEIVEAAGMQDQVVLMSLNFAGIKKLRELRPAWTLGLLSSVAMGKLNELDIDFLALNARSASRPRIRNTQDKGKQVMVWTVNDAVGMSVMFSRGVDAIITDEPALAVSILEQRANVEPVQRLLMHLADAFDQPSLYREQ